MQCEYNAVFPSPLGNIGLILRENVLVRVHMLANQTKAQHKNPNTMNCEKIIAALHAYFDDPQYLFELPYQLEGSPFQQRVWQALTTIPSGETLTYGQLANQLNSSPRAIGQACRTNPLPIIIPCHRILAASHLGGYAGTITGKLMDIKKWLLRHEGIMC